jgi:hypothetical protein
MMVTPPPAYEDVPVATTCRIGEHRAAGDGFFHAWIA